MGKDKHFSTWTDGYNSAVLYVLYLILHIIIIHSTRNINTYSTIIYDGAHHYHNFNLNALILMHNSHALTITNNNGENVLHITKHRNHQEPVFTGLKHQPPTTNRVCVVQGPHLESP